MNYIDIIRETLAKEKDRITAVSDQIWEFAEVRYEEQQSAELMAKTLEEAGFDVVRNAGGSKPRSWRLLAAVHLP